MATLNPYLNFPGTPRKHFNFYKSVFGGEFTMLQRFKDTPERAGSLTRRKRKLCISLYHRKGKHSYGNRCLESMGHKVDSRN